MALVAVVVAEEDHVVELCMTGHSMAFLITKMALEPGAAVVVKEVSQAVVVKVDREEALHLQSTCIKMAQTGIYMTVSFPQETMALEVLEVMVVPGQWWYWR